MKIIPALVFNVPVCNAGVAAQHASSGKSAPQQAAKFICSIGDNHSSLHVRGASGMGFSQTATTHHFLLNNAGGVIEVEVNAPTDIDARASHPLLVFRKRQSEGADRQTRPRLRPYTNSYDSS
jgi:hypothetical protein